METKITKLRVSSGQYETCTVTVVVKHKTWYGLLRRISQLEHEHGAHGDNFAGWIPARVALANENDEFGDNQIIGGQWCEPANGWLSVDRDDFGQMSYARLKQMLYKEGKC